jgi:hypothetical protein
MKTGYTVEYNGCSYEVKHGDPFDRGSADSYYGRTRRPHKGGVGGDSGSTKFDLTLQEIADYMAGYDWNEANGDKKNWD